MDPFAEYKRPLEDLLQNVSFLYSGDIITSTDKSLSMNLKHESFSPELIRKVLIDIYNESFDNLISKSKKISVSSESVKNIYDILNLVNNPSFIFYSNNSLMNIDLPDSEFLDTKSFLPSHFYDRLKLSNGVSGFFSPNIKDIPDDSQIIITDRPIQSLVWSLQNMNYEVLCDDDVKRHIVNYSIYDCDFDSTIIHIKNINKIRDERIHSILSDNFN